MNSTRQVTLDIVDESTIRDDEIPDAVRNFTPPAKKVREKKTANKSNFIITLNPNISWRSVNSNDARLLATRKLIAVCKNVELNLANHKLLKDFPSAATYKHPTITKYHYAIERRSSRVSSCARHGYVRWLLPNQVGGSESVHGCTDETIQQRWVRQCKTVQ